MELELADGVLWEDLARRGGMGCMADKRRGRGDPRKWSGREMTDSGHVGTHVLSWGVSLVMFEDLGICNG